MTQLASFAMGAIVGFALVFLGPPGLALGVVAAVAYAAVPRHSHRFGRVGAALVGGGLVVAAVAGRTVLTALLDPAVSYEPSTALAVVVGPIVALAGAIMSIWIGEPRVHGR